MNSQKPCSCSRGCSANGGDAASLDAVPAPRHDGSLVRSVFRVPGMDCPSEERMIRLRLAEAPVASLAFDLPARTLVVDHTGDAAEILQRLVPLGYGAELRESRPLSAEDAIHAPTDDATEARVLWTLLGINAVMFVIEMVAGWWAGSAGLISDAADMFADAAVYGVSLYAVGRDTRHKLSAARLAGILQLALAVATLAETGRRILTGDLPEEMAMVGISLLALAANVACLVLVSGHRKGSVHMRASFIFSANDVLANLGVIVAGVLVAWTASPVPDWAVGTLIGMTVLVGAVRILKLR